MEEEEALIQRQINSFFVEMNKWEKFCNSLEDDSSISYQEKEELQKMRVSEIFKKYCTRKERLQGKPNIISFGQMGSYIYNIEEEKIREIVFDSSLMSTVSTEREQPMSEMYQYTIKKIKGIWLIDSKKRYSTWERKWKNEEL